MIDSIDSPYIHAANADNFKALVLANSNKGPVLVNFWSKKAGPCLRQYPVLDKIIHQFNGRMLLVNIDTEAEYKVGKEYSVTSVPTLKLFRNEKVIETLHGYQSETDLNRVLSQYIAKDSDQALADAIAEYTKGNHGKAYQMITDAIVGDPDNSQLPISLCKLLKHEQRYADALKLLASLPTEMHKLKEIIVLQDELSFLVIADKITDVEALIEIVSKNANDLLAKQQLSAFYVLNKEYATALQLLVDIMEIDKTYNDAYPRVAMLKIFNILGQDHELVAQFRASLRCYTH
ncbi:hypothetical protein MNBD_GAMMA23-2448 [hydrothermal vent metagenome]|uniref:Thioredoxin domain-containing protein n=1 Tax=hydrothermal vent metagenome TaxID=652676 RepID=A0A3B0ZYV3_9ZZZZ